MTQTTNRETPPAASLVADGSYPSRVVAVELTITPEAIPAWELTFLIRDHSSAQQFIFPLTLPLDAAHVPYTIGIITTINPQANLEPLPYDPIPLGLVGRRCLLIISNDTPIGIDRLNPDAAANSPLMAL